MTKISTVHYRKLIKLFKDNGFVFNRQKGDYVVYVRDDIKRPLVIPVYKEIPVFIIKKNLKTAGIDRKVYLKYLGIIK